MSTTTVQLPAGNFQGSDFMSNNILNSEETVKPGFPELMRTGGWLDEDNRGSLRGFTQDSRELRSCCLFKEDFELTGGQSSHKPLKEQKRNHLNF